MKAILAIMFLAIGLAVWPPGEPVKAATVDNVCFVIDQPAAPVCAVMAPVQEKGGDLIVCGYNSIDVKAVLIDAAGELSMNYKAIIPPKAASLDKVYTKHLKKVNHPPLLSKVCISKDKVWPEYGLIRIRSMQDPTQNMV